MGKKSGLDLSVIPRLNRLITTLKPDVIHTHQYAMKYVFPSVLQARRVMVHTVHSLADKELNRRDQVIQNFTYRRGVMPVAIAEEVAAGVEKIYEVRPAVIPNGVDIEGIRASASLREQNRQAFGWRPEDVVMVSIARLSAPKDHATLLTAFAQATQMAPNLRLALVGDGALRSELEAQSRALNLESRVAFLGVQADIPGILAAADAKILSSDYEGNPLSVMEAMAAGKAVVASRVGGIPQLISHERDGLLFTAGDSSSLAGYIARLSRADERARLGDAAQMTAAEKFSLSEMAERYLTLYAQSFMMRIQGGLHG